MKHMFYVRSARVPWAPTFSRLRHTPSYFPVRISPRIVCPLTRQCGVPSAINQPLSFDTSKVTDMHGMFGV